jgi:hypothetical protein
MALTPLPDSSNAFFVGDWIGVGADDNFCFMRLRSDGSGAVLVNGASGDWLGATIRWRNQRQNFALLEFIPMPFEPHRRLMPLKTLVVNSGVNKTIRLQSTDGDLGCELQLRADVLQHAEQAEHLLGPASDARKAGGGK